MSIWATLAIDTGLRYTHKWPKPEDGPGPVWEIATPVGDPYLRLVVGEEFTVLPHAQVLELADALNSWLERREPDGTFKEEYTRTPEEIRALFPDSPVEREA